MMGVDMAWIGYSSHLSIVYIHICIYINKDKTIFLPNDRYDKNSPGRNSDHCQLTLISSSVYIWTMKNYIGHMWSSASMQRKYVIVEFP